MKNMGTADRVLRALVIAPVLVVAGIAASGVWAIVAFALAAIMLGTAAVGFCPLYRPFGFSTCPREART